MDNWAIFQSRIGVTFRDQSLLQQAFVHRSHLNENSDFPLSSNERLEFLGDALLGFVVAEALYDQPEALNEGEMTKLRATLVSKDSLAAVAYSLCLGDYLYLGQGEEKSGGREKSRTLACALEALLGAIFLDQGLSVARDFIWRLFGDDLHEAVRFGIVVDHKTRLQEMVQAEQKGLPFYRVVDIAGPNHDKVFTVEVVVSGGVIGKGSGKSKQAAEKDAARMAIGKLLG